jgi:hypothetical protein
MCFLDQVPVAGIILSKGACFQQTYTYRTLTEIASLPADDNFTLYSKGSNFIPMDAFFNRVTHEDAEKLLTSFVDGNQNMLRIW